MNGSVLNFVGNFNNFLYENADPRIRDKFLMGLPYWIILSYLLYTLIILYIFPSIMKNRKPLDFHKVTIYTDALLIIISFYFLIVSGIAWTFSYNWHCQPILPAGSKVGDLHVEFCWQFVVTRYFYCLHSLPFVLSKRKSSLANYLLIHHAVFPIMVWTLVNYYPGGHTTFGGLINSFTHVMLFGIKFVMIWRPEVKRVRRTFHVVMHLFQFFAIVLHSSQFIISWNYCEIPIIVPIAVMAYALTIAAFYYIFVIYQQDSIKEAFRN